MGDETKKQVDSDIARSMDLFERADVGPQTVYQGRSPERILVVRDGSSQDNAVVKLAGQLHQRLGCQLKLSASFFGAVECRGR